MQESTEFENKCFCSYGAYFHFNAHKKINFHSFLLQFVSPLMFVFVILMLVQILCARQCLWSYTTVLWDNELESLSVLIAGHYYMMANVFVWNLISSFIGQFCNLLRIYLFWSNIRIRATIISLMITKENNKYMCLIFQNCIFKLYKKMYLLL